MAWGVHEHLTAMMVGGFSSLTVQALNPQCPGCVLQQQGVADTARKRASAALKTGSPQQHEFT